MSKWMHLLEEIEKNATPENSPLSVLSVPSKAHFLKSEESLEASTERELPYFESLSVLSVAHRGASLKFNKAKNIEKNALEGTDNTDNSRWWEEEGQDSPIIPPLKSGEIKNIGKNASKGTDNTDSGASAGENRQDIHIPPPFSQAIDIIRERPKPEQIGKSRWIAIVQRLNILVQKERRHLLKMIEYSWSLEELFGCHKGAPDERIDGMGLLMLIADLEITEIHPRKASLKSKRGAITSYYEGMLNGNPAGRSTLMEIE